MKGILQLVLRFIKIDLAHFISVHWKKIVIALGILGLMYGSFWFGRNKYPNCDIMSQEIYEIERNREEAQQAFDQKYYRMEDSLSRLIKHDTVLKVKKEKIYIPYDKFKEIYITDYVADSLMRANIKEGKDRFPSGN